MKKLLSVAFALIMALSLNVASAQQKAKPTKAKSDSTVTHTKKDGTPDKRYKENKTTPTPVHTKKDGTPDKRYKENKATPATPAKS